MFMKYIVIKNHGFEEMVIFSNTMNHCDVAHRLGAKAISAGRCRLDRSSCSFVGESVSLGILSRPEDKNLFLKQFEEY